MANSLGTLSIDVVSNIATLVSDLGRAQSETAKATRQMQQQWEQFGSGVESALSNIASTLGVAFSVDQLVEFSRQSLETAQHVEDMAQSIGASTKTIQTLSYAAGVSGASVDVFTGALARLEKSANQAASGNKQAVAAFNAIGISAQQAGQLLKDPDKLIQVVTQHIAQFADGGGKVPVVMQLMGRGASENIPVINKLGQQYAQLADEARKAGVVLSEQDTKALADAQVHINQVGQDVKGLANEFTLSLVPAIDDASERFHEFMGSAEVRTDVQAFGAGLSNVALHLGDIQTAVFGLTQIGLPTFMGDAAREAGNLATQSEIVYEILKKIRDVVPNFDWIKTAEQKVQDLGAKTMAAATSFWNSFISGSDAKGWAQAQIQINGALQQVTDHSKEAGAAVDEFGLHLADSGKASTGATKPLIDYDAAAKDTTRTLASAQVEAAKFMQSLAGVGADKYTKALDEYNARLATADQIFNKLVDSGEKTEDVLKFIAEATKLAADGFDALQQGMRNANDADSILQLSNAKAESDLNEQIRLLGLDEQSREADALATKLITAALGDLKDFMGPLTEAQQAEIDKANAMAHAFVGQKTSIDLAKQAAQDYVNIWKNAGGQLADTFAKILVEGGSLFDGLKSLAQQTVEAIISYFEKLAIINPILNAIFGGSAGFSLLPELGNLLGGGGAAAAGNAALNWTTDTTGTEAAASNASLFGTAGQGASLFNAGKTIFSGFQSGLSNLFLGSGSGGSSIFGTSIGGDFGSSFAPSAFGYGVAGVGGLYAGYNEFQNAGGGFAGLAGGAAYGVGTAALGLGIASAASGGGLIAGLGALGPVGWAGIALMAVDMLSGGKLFGTKGKFNFGESAITVGSSGATVSAGYDLKGQKPLFGGSTHSWQTLPVDPAAQAAADQFFAALKNSTADFAKQFGTTMGDIVGGQFTATFDKNGNITKTSDTVLGKTYADTQAQFEERLQAENMLAVLGNFDKGLNAAVDQFRANADQLMAVTQALANGETMMQAGTQFLALGTDQSLTSLLKLAEGSQQFGESIDQTLARLEQAQSAYDQFVAQFKPAASYVDDFEGALSQINATMNANIKQANALAIAAGAQGASEKDLANIHAYAAKQAADAIAALEASAQSLAFSLGLTTVGSLDQVNQEIASLQAKANSGSSAVSSFGNAIQAAAQKASAAINLLIGDLSPLNDQQKLQTALQGLRAGTVTADQVLTIGKRLYASSQQYVDLFNMVKSMGGSGAATGGGVAATHGGLSAADSKRLADLLKEQQQLQASAQLQQYQTLAQQVAEIASAKGEDWQQVLKDMKINIADFEKGLGLNDKQTGDYIDAIQKQTDSNGDNTQSIIAVLNQILTALGGTPTGDPGGHSGHSTGRTLTVDDIIRGVRDGIARGLGDVGHQGARNLRGLQIPVGVR